MRPPLKNLKPVPMALFAIGFLFFPASSHALKKLIVKESDRTVTLEGEVQSLLTISARSDAGYGGYVAVSLTAVAPNGSTLTMGSMMLRSASSGTLADVEMVLTLPASGDVTIVAEAIGFSPGRLSLNRRGEEPAPEDLRVRADTWMMTPAMVPDSQGKPPVLAYKRQPAPIPPIAIVSAKRQAQSGF